MARYRDRGIFLEQGALIEMVPYMKEKKVAHDGRSIMPERAVTKEANKK